MFLADHVRFCPLHKQQARLSTLEEEVFQASLAAVQKDAVVSALRRQLACDAIGGNRGSPPPPTQRCGSVASRAPSPECETSWKRNQRGSVNLKDAVGSTPVRVPYSTRPCTGRTATAPGCDCSASVIKVPPASPPRRHNRDLLHGSLGISSYSRTPASASRFAVIEDHLNSHCSHVRRDVVVASDPSPRRRRAAAAPVSMPHESMRDRRQSQIAIESYSAIGDGCCGGGGTGGSGSPGKGDRSVERRCTRTRTPTTDILRRLLYESTPLPGSRGEGTATTAAGGSSSISSGPSRRLFAACCGDAGRADDWGEKIHQDAALFSDSANLGGNHSIARKCGNGTGGIGIGDRNDGGTRDGTAADVAAAGMALDSKADSGERCARSAATRNGSTNGEVVLRERLLQAREDFATLRSGISTNKLTV